MIWSWYTGRWWVGCYIWYSEEGTGRGRSPPRPLLAVPNITARPSTASVLITVLMYNSPLLCTFNVPWRVKQLIISISVPFRLVGKSIAVFMKSHFECSTTTAIAMLYIKSLRKITWSIANVKRLHIYCSISSDCKWQNLHIYRKAEDTWKKLDIYNLYKTNRVWNFLKTLRSEDRHVTNI